jgi:4-hydroxy-tetrahydrodipicolinate synthase
MTLHASSLPAVLSPVLTPFDGNQGVDLAKFLRQCQWLQENGVGLAVFGTNSEANSLSAGQKIEAVQHLVRSGISPAQMMPGTGACSIADAVAMTKAAVEAKCAGVLMLPPFYYKDVSEDGLFAYYANVIEKVGNSALQVYIYNIPPVVKFGIPVTLLERLVKAYPKTVVGMKDSSGDWAYTESCILALASEGFRVYAGSETFLLKTLRAGGAGCISATANVNPRAISTLAAHWQDADADQKQAALDAVRATFAKHPMIAAMKSAVSRYAKDPTWNKLLPPLISLSEDAQNSLYADLDALGFAMPGLSK